MENIRTSLNFPLVIRSGYRTPVHNSSIGSATTSQHLRGTAADITRHDYNGDGLVNDTDKTLLRNAAATEGAWIKDDYDDGHTHVDWGH